MEIIDWVSAVVVLIIAALVSGCGISSNLELYPIHDRLETKTVKTDHLPFVCYFKNCNTELK